MTSRAFALIACSAVRHARSLLIRYAALDPQPARGYLRKSGLPMLRSSICLAERHLVPVLKNVLHMLTTYVIYTDAGTHEPVWRLLTYEFPELEARVRLINLDEDPADDHRVAEFRPLGLDPINFASVRRTLADAVHLPAEESRLLLGTDISFSARQTHFVAELQRTNRSQALYMVDDKVWNGSLYTLTAYLGPQCPGLLGDFVYLGPDLHISVENLQSKLRWYAAQPITSTRTDPPIKWLAERNGSEVLHAKEHGLHAIDQFALNLAVGEAVVPAGSRGCFPLNTKYHVHLGLLSRTEAATLEAEAIHDKVISSCGMASFDRCDVDPFSDQVRLSSGTCRDNSCGARSATRCPWDALIVTNPEREYLPGDLLAHLRATMCLSENFLPATIESASLVLPSYTVFTNDKTCGPTSSYLSHEWDDIKDRIKLINLDRASSRDDWMQEYMSLTEGGGAVLFESLRRTLAGWTALPFASGRLILGLEVRFVSTDDSWSAQELVFSVSNFRNGLHLFHVNRGETFVSEPWLELFARFVSLTT